MVSFSFRFKSISLISIIMPTSATLTTRNISTIGQETTKETDDYTVQPGSHTAAASRLFFAPYTCSIYSITSSAKMSHRFPTICPAMMLLWISSRALFFPMCKSCWRSLRVRTAGISFIMIFTSKTESIKIMLCGTITNRAKP